MPGQISYGFVCGFCSGYALKKAGRTAAFLFGTGFILSQGLSYTGYINVNYERLHKDISDMMDVNDDGKVDEQDVKIMYENVWDEEIENRLNTASLIEGIYTMKKS